MWREPSGDVHPLWIIRPEAQFALYSWIGRVWCDWSCRGGCSPPAGAVILFVRLLSLFYTDRIVWLVYFYGLTWLVLSQAGDRVFATGTLTGGYAEYTVASEDTVHKLPDSLDFKQGAAIGIPYFTAYRALFHKYVVWIWHLIFLWIYTAYLLFSIY